MTRALPRSLLIVNIGSDELDGPLYGILGIVPRLGVVAVVELLAEPTDVFREGGHVVVDHLAHLGGELGQLLLVQPFLTVFQKLFVMGDAEVGLGTELGAKVLVCVPKVDHALGHMLEMVVNSLTDVAGLLQLGDTFDGFGAWGAQQAAVLDIAL